MSQRGAIRIAWAATAAIAVLARAASAAPDPQGAGNRFAYLDEVDPYWPGRAEVGGVHSPRLTTPMWIGEEGVDAAVVLSIDDMRDPAQYETFLRPILERLKQVEGGRAPMSIFTCEVKPEDPQLQKFLVDGVSLEVHTLDHPCPLFREGDVEKAVASVVKCGALLDRIPNQVPVAFRMPCCDSINTNSPRFYSAVLPAESWSDGKENKETWYAEPLSVDSSVAMLFTSDDPELPRELVQEKDGSERFRKYLPADRRFANYIENHPYPYVIGNRCWELPWVVPTDWQGQHLQGPCNEKTFDDLKAALDCTVLKQGLFTLVFHPHGWSRPDQVVGLIDHAVAKYGKRVKFLSVRDVKQRLDRNVLRLELITTGFRKADESWGRHQLLAFPGHVRLPDLDGDGALEAMTIGLPAHHDEAVPAGHFVDYGATRRWSPGDHAWLDVAFPSRLGFVDPEHGDAWYYAAFGVIHADGRASLLQRKSPWAGSFDGARWIEEPELLQLLRADGTRGDLVADGQPVDTSRSALPRASTGTLRLDRGVRLRDLDGDGRCELLVANESQNAVFRWDAKEKGWRELSFKLPSRCRIVDAHGRDEGLRWIDLDEDGDLDLVVSGFHQEASQTLRESGVWLFESMERGWSREVQHVVASADAPSDVFKNALPPIVRADHSNNGMWVKDRALWWVNEDTDKLPSHVDRRSFNELVAPAFPIGTEPPPRSPAASLHSLHLRPGFTVELVAAEPLVADPISIEWGADGKLWVVEMGDYPLGADGKRGGDADASTAHRDPFGAPGGRIKFLEDVDADGRYDRATTFLDGLSFPTSVLPWRDGVLITAAPDILFAADRDGDGKAEVREVLFTGFHQGNPQHRVNGLRPGLDGWVYGANGDSGGTIHCVKTGADVAISGRDWRIDPDRGLLETESGETQYGRDRNDFGDWFGGNNSNPCWQFVLEDRWLRRNPFVDYPDARVDVPEVAGSAPVFPLSITRARFNDLDTANHFTSACSPCVYRDRLFGPAFSSSLFVCEPVHNLVHREVLRREGVTWKSRRAADETNSEFLASSDPWFRPVQTRTGPDGALWVVDMYRDVIEHPEWIPEATQKQLDLRAGADMGRIYRVYPVGTFPRPMVRMDGLMPKELVAAIDDGNGWRRDTAQRLLSENLHVAKGEAATDLRKQVAAPLEEIVRHSPRRVARVQALATLAQLGLLELKLVWTALADVDGEVRRIAVRVAEPRLDQEKELLRAVVELAQKDSEPAVRLQAVASLGNVHDPDVAATLAAPLAAVLRDAESRPDLEGAMLASTVMSSLSPPLLDAFLDSRIASVPDAAAAIVPLARMTVAMQVPAAIDRLLALATPRRDVAATEGETELLTVTLDAIDSLGSEAWDALIAARPALQQRMDAGADTIAAARVVVQDAAADPATRARRVALLGHDAPRRATDLDLLTTLLAPTQPVELQSAALAALVATQDESVPARLLAGWKSHAPALRAAAVAALLAREEWLPALLDAVAAKQASPGDFSLVQRQRLLAHDDDAIRARAAELLQVQVNADRQAVIESLRPALALAGDTTRGAALFEKKCATCHQIGDVGHRVGADLAAIADQSPETLLISILDPNRAVESRYISYSAFTKQGDILAGIVARETSSSVTLIDSGGKEQTVLRADLEELRSSAKSLMPDGLEEGLTAQDFADLLTFVRARKAARKEFPGNEPVTLRPAEAGGALHLRAAQAAIYGPSIVLEAKYHNLGFWSDAKDHATWTLELPAAGRYAVHLHYACDDGTAVNTLTLEAAGHTLQWSVAGTGTWDNYQEVVVGELDLPAGRVEFDARPATPPRGALLDLRELVLVRKSE